MMKYELPCEVVKDLLPSYIDGLVGENTKESVKAHLEGCEKCHETYENMKNEMDSPGVPEKKEESEQEKNLYKKINRKLHKKMWIAIGAGVAAVLLVIGGVELLYDAMIKSVHAEDIAVSACVYTFEEYQELDMKDASVLKLTEDGGKYMDDMGYKVAGLEPDDSLTVVEIESPYILEQICYWETEEDADDRVLYLKDIKTTILNNRLSDGIYRSTLDCFGEFEKIVYLDGKERVILWERGQE